jgi:hypothetical protein
MVFIQECTSLSERSGDPVSCGAGAKFFKAKTAEASFCTPKRLLK